MTTKILDAEKLIKTVVTEGENLEIDYAAITEVGEGRFILDVSMQSIPREDRSLLLWDTDYHAFSTSTSTSDCGPTESYEAGWGTWDEEEAECVKGIDIADGTTLTIGVAGNTNFPEYCDDESDGSFNGRYYFEDGNGDWVREQVKESYVESLGRETSDRLASVSPLVKQMRDHGADGPLCLDAATSLMRELLCA